MATSVNLTPATIRRVLGHRVYLRTSWTIAWEKVPYLFAEEVAWRLAPGIGTATLVWHYGRGIRQGELNPSIISKLTDKGRAFVKVVIDAVPTTEAELDAGTASLEWYGIVELDGSPARWLVDNGDGETYTEAGVQVLQCVHLAHALYRHPIRGATWRDANGAEQRAGTPIVFNQPGADGHPLGNRSAAKGLNTYLFSSVIGEADAMWSSRTMADYLCRHEVPKKAGNEPAFKLLLDDEDHLLLPDWDQPVIDPHGMHTADVLNLLMPRTRMLSWRLQIEEDPDADDPGVNETVWLTPVSLLGADVVTDLGTLPKNPRQLRLQDTIALENSPDIRYDLRENELQVIDQARVYGAVRTSTVSVSSRDGNLELGHHSDLQDEYDEAFSGDAGYAALSRADKQWANNQIRTSDRLQEVYRRIQIPHTWDQKAKNGEGDGDARAVFLKVPTSVDQVYLVDPRELSIAPTLPLKDGFLYELIGTLTLKVDPVKFGSGPFNRLPAFVVFESPQADGGHSEIYEQVEKIASSAPVELVTPDGNRWWSGQVEIPADDRAILIHVQGQPQHVLAYSDFTKLDDDPYLGKWDWRDAIFTVCLYDDRRAEGVWPEDLQAEQSIVGTKRELCIYAGDEYRQDYLVPNTVIGLDPTTRGLTRCTNGGWIQDDRKVLQARAKQVFAYYGQPRKALTLETALVTTQIRVGDYIASFGNAESAPLGPEIGTVVSEVVVSLPESGRLPTIRYATAFAELEPGEVLNKRPERRPQTLPAKVQPKFV